VAPTTSFPGLGAFSTSTSIQFARTIGLRCDSMCGFVAPENVAVAPISWSASRMSSRTRAAHTFEWTAWDTFCMQSAWWHHGHARVSSDAPGVDVMVSSLMVWSCWGHTWRSSRSGHSSETPRQEPTRARLPSPWLSQPFI